MPRVQRSDILARFRAMKARGEPIIGAGAGTGISAKGEEAGGADLIVIYNSGRYRMAGRGSLAGMMPYRRRQRHRRRNGARGPAGRWPHAGSRRRLRHRPVPPDGRLSRRSRAAGLQRRAEFPDGRAHRRPLPRRSRRDRHGLWPRGRHDRQGARARPADHALRVQPGGSRSDGARRRRHPGLPFRADRRRLDRRRDCDQAGGLPGADRRDGGGGARGEPRRAHSRSRRADRRAGRRRIRAGARQALRRLLRRLVDGAPAGRAGAVRAGRKIQINPENCKSE